MPYEVQNKLGATGLAEALWASGHDPILFYEDALWTPADAVAQGLRCIEFIPGASRARALDAHAEAQWELAIFRATLENGLAGFPTELADAMRKGLEHGDPPPCHDDLENDEGEDA